MLEVKNLGIEKNKKKNPTKPLYQE